MTTKQRLGEVLIKAGLVTEEQISDALKLQAGGNRRLGYLLVKMGIINNARLIEILSNQLGLSSINISDHFSQEAQRIVPRYLCRKYNLIPLSRQQNNILLAAMMDPLDDEAITAIENYTGMAVKPCLAAYKDITSSINRFIPFSIKDIFNPQVYGIAAKVTTAIAFILLLTLGFITQRNIHIAQYGTVSIVGDSMVFKHHDLRVSSEADGKTSLLGRGAHAKGYYAVSFDNIESLKKFLAKQKKSFSQKQNDWLLWVIDQKIEKQR